MPLPNGFKVNGASSVTIPDSPQVKKIKTILDVLPFTELLTTRELGNRMGLMLNGINALHPSLDAYREKVDGRNFWGSRKSIERLRKQLAEPEDSNDQN